MLFTRKLFAPKLFSFEVLLPNSSQCLWLFREDIIKIGTHFKIKKNIYGSYYKKLLKIQSVPKIWTHWLYFSSSQIKQVYLGYTNREGILNKNRWWMTLDWTHKTVNVLKCDVNVELLHRVHMNLAKCNKNWNHIED